MFIEGSRISSFINIRNSMNYEVQNKQSQPKLDLSQNKYLLINATSLLSARVTYRVPMKDDLVLRQLEEGVSSIFMGGKQVVEYLNKLATEYGYAIVLYSNRKEQQIIHDLEELDEACKREALIRLPKITAMIVKDRETYQNIRPSNLRVTEDRLHGILVAGYGLQAQQETEILHGCSKWLNFSKLEQNRYVVVDNHSSFIKKAKEEGWNAFETDSIPLKTLLWDLFQKSANPKNKTKKDNSDQRPKKEEPKSEMVKLNNFPMEIASPSDLEAIDSYLQETIDSRWKLEQKNWVNEPGSAIVKPTANSFDPSLTSLKASDSTSQKLFQMNVKMEISNKKEEYTENNEFEELEKWVPHDLSPSDLKFQVIKGAQPQGSSPSLRWFLSEETDSKWVGKCSLLGLSTKDYFNEHKEFLGSLFYRYFGVRTPNTVFSEQILGEELKRMSLFGISDIDGPRVHLMSSFVPGFKVLGDQFIDNYKVFSKTNKKQLFHMKEGNKPLRGLGKVVAVSILIHDYDFIGNSGTNIGYVPSEDGECFEILKIDPGESLSFAEDLSMATSLNNPPSNRGALAAPEGKRIDFDDLNEFDKRECVETIKKILEITVPTLEQIFSPFLKTDDKFKMIFEELLNRRKELLASFYGEVGSLIEHYIREIEEEQASEQMLNWGKLPLSLDLQREKKARLFRSKAQLEATTAAMHANLTDAKNLQASPYRKVTFVGRETELSQIKKIFSGDTGIIGCAIVGGAGLGKSQLATEYILRNQKEMYSEVVWLYAEQSELLIDQIQIYLETYYKIKVNPQDKDKKDTLIREFYQILSKKDDALKNSPKKPCIVFDNADSMTQIADFMPNKNTYPKLMIDIIVTSRYKKWKEPIGTIIEMQPFGIAEIKNYIRSSVPDPGMDKDDDQLSKDAEKLNDLVDGLPLALSLAAAYIRQNGIGVSEFCGFVIQENNKELISLQSQKVSEKDGVFGEDGDESRKLNIVSTILTLALVDLRLKHNSAEPILDILAYLSPNDLSKALLSECFLRYLLKKIVKQTFKKRVNKLTSEKIPDQYLEDLVGELINKARAQQELDIPVEMQGFNALLDLFSSYSIITTNPIQNQSKESENVSIQNKTSNNFKIHQLTQQVIRLNHQKSGVYDIIYQRVFDLIVEKLDFDERDPKAVQRASLIIPHGIYLESLPKNLKDDKIAHLLELIGKYQLHGAGYFHGAKEYYQKALTIKTKFYGKDHPQTGSTLINLADACGALYGYEKQRDYLVRALEIYEKFYGKDDLKTSMILLNLADVSKCLGKFEEQKDLITRTLEIQEKNYGKDHPQIGVTLHNLAAAYGLLGNNNEKKKDLLTRALEINEKHYGKDHPLTALTLTDLGDAWGSLGYVDKKKDLLTRALKIDEKNFDKDDPNASRILALLADRWGNIDEHEKQKDLLTRALEIDEKIYGKDHPQTGSTLEKLAKVWGSSGNLDKQKDLLTQALEIYEKNYGKDHLATRYIIGNLANAWGELGNYEKKKDLLTRALEIDEKHYGKDHPLTGSTLEKLAKVWGSLGNFEKQKDILTRSLEIYEKHYGKDHPQTSCIIGYLANTWGELGNYEKKKDLLTRALEIDEKNYGENDLLTAITLSNLGLAWGELGEFEIQEYFLARAMVLFQGPSVESSTFDPLIHIMPPYKM